MNKLLLLQFLGYSQYGYNPEYENLSEEEKNCLDYVDECLIDKDEKFSNACTDAMFLVLETITKLGTNEELASEEVLLKKEKILLDFNQEVKERLETFMYACIQTVGIYSEERIKERKLSRENNLSKKLKKS